MEEQKPTDAQKPLQFTDPVKIPRVIETIVLTDGTIFRLGDDWPGPDGKPNPQIRGRIWVICYQGESTDHFPGSSESNEPAVYRMIMKSNLESPDGNAHGIVNPKTGIEETEILDFYPHQVRFVFWRGGFWDSFAQIDSLIRSMNPHLFQPPKPPPSDDDDDDYDDDDEYDDDEEADEDETETSNGQKQPAPSA